jgi:hypothetical protein
MSYFDKKITVDVAILDLSKAFDTVPHDKLLHTISHYGVNGDLHSWICNFLTSRHQRVVVNGEHSDNIYVASGVPQGTVLDPLLFLLFINDLPSVVKSQVRLFADDCLIYRPIMDSRDQYLLDQDLAALSQWADTWGMKYNPQKCFIMTIANNKNPPQHFYSLCHLNTSIVCVDPFYSKSMILNTWESQYQTTLDGSDILQQQQLRQTE